MRGILAHSLPLPVGVFETDVNGRLTAANDAFRRLALDGAPLPLGGAPWANAHPGDRAAAELSWRRAVEQGDVIHVEFRVWRSDGGMTWIALDAQAVRETDGSLTGYVGTASDHTRAVQDRVLNERFMNLLGAQDDAIIIVDRHGAPIYVNDAAHQLLGVHTDAEFVREPTPRSFMQAVRDQLPREALNGSGSTSWKGEIAFRDLDGFNRTLEVTMLVERGSDGIVEYYAGVARDVTTTRQVQHELLHQATHDALTGLPNRTLFLRKLAEAIERGRTLRTAVAVLFLDLDNLKDVNDSIGHEVGDVLLSHVAKRIIAATRPADVVARIGGDEFVVLCEGVADEHAAVDLAERVRSGITGRTMLMGSEVMISASVGVAVVHPASLDDSAPADAAVTLLRNADTAMYRAKQRGKMRVELFTDEMHSTARDRMELTSQLELAQAGGQLELLYQPILSAHTGRLAGVEALLRWNHPERGTLTPPMFVPLAEESGLIIPIGDWVVRQACADARAWMDAGAADRTFVMTVNVSARQLADAVFVERTLAVLQEYGLEANQLVIELIEHTVIDDDLAVNRSLQALKRFGVRLSIDDFGTGYSSVSFLRRFQADFLKLDGTFVRELGVEGTEDAVVRSVIQLAHSLNMSVVAEWVTTDDQYQRLRLLGCDYVQGYRLGEPMAADELLERALVMSRRA